MVTPPPAEWDLIWDRITDHIRAPTRTLADTTAFPDCVPGILSSLLRAAGDALDLQDDAADERRRALDAAIDAHRRLTSVLADDRYEITPALGGLTADTRRLLTDLTAVVTAPGATPDRTAPARVPQTPRGTRRE